jgi:hypothetical protein
VRGPQGIATTLLGDFVVRRASGEAMFFFSNAIDDALSGVTLVLRGEDHLSNTARQILLLRALGLPVPEYGHLPLVLSEAGVPLSKREGAGSVAALRDEGFLPIAIINYLARLGAVVGSDALLTIPELAAVVYPPPIREAPAREYNPPYNTTPPESVHLDLKPRYSFQMPPRLLKLEEKPVPPLEANEAEPDLPPTADPSSDSTGQDSVANNTIENPLHPGESGDPSASSRPVEESNSSNAPGTFERIADTPAEEPQPDKTAPAEETMPPTTKEITPKDGSSATVAPPVLLERKTSTQNQSHDKDRETDEKENAEQTAKSETVGTRRRSQPSEDFRTQFDDEEDATSDLYLSPRLGPVDLFQGRHRYALPRVSTPAKVPKWTVQA